MRDHVELLDGLRLPVLEDRHVVGEETGHEAALVVEHDGVDFDEVGGRPERRLLGAALSRRGRLSLEG